MRNLHPRTLVLAAVSALSLTACALVPPDGTVTAPPGPPASPEPLPTLAATPTASDAASATPAPPALPAGWSNGEDAAVDPARTISLTWPDVADAAGLTGAIRGWLGERRTAFEAGFAPNVDAPPTLAASWEATLDAQGGVVGVRETADAFDGATQTVTPVVFHFDRATGTSWRGRDLVAAGQEKPFAEAVVAALQAGGTDVLADLAREEDLQDRLLDALTFDAAGNLVVALSPTELLTYCGDATEAVVPAATADAFLTDAGRTVKAAYLAAGSVVPTASGKPSPTPATAAPAASTTASGDVDCMTVACVALTFDDGPGPYTEGVLDDLSAAHARATFFLVGQNVHKRAATVARMAAEGDEVGNHTWDHPKLPTLSAAEQGRQLDRTSAAIAAAGAKATVFRPSYGAYNATTKQVAGLPLILWNVDTLDWKTRNADTTVRIAQCGARRNAIVLMHDIHAPSAEAVPRVVAALQAKGLTLVTVSHLLRGRDQPGVAYEHG